MNLVQDEQLHDQKIVSSEEWLEKRKDLLRKERDFTRLRDELRRERAQLTWVKVEKKYVFDSPQGEMTLCALFAGRSQLFIKHFMMRPGAADQCVGCSLAVEHVDGLLEHLENHDVSYAAVARAPIEEIEVVRPPDIYFNERVKVNQILWTVGSKNVDGIRYTAPESGLGQSNARRFG